MSTTIIASVGPEIKKIEENLSPYPEIVKCDSNVFEIDYGVLYNLGVDHHIAIEETAALLGMINTAFFSKSCNYCHNNTQSAMAWMSGKTATLSQDNVTHANFSDSPKEGDIRVISDTSVLEETCRYHPEIDIGWAGTMSSKGNRVWFYAERSRCAFDDALISHLAGNGHLDAYKTDKPYNFRPLSEFVSGKANPKDFQVQRPLRYRIPLIGRLLK
jgi:hypothetical protein